MKKYCLFLLFLVLIVNLSADYILKTSGGEIKNCKIQELKEDTLFFRKDNKLYKIRIEFVKSFKIEKEEQGEGKKIETYSKWDFDNEQLLQAYYDLVGKSIMDSGKYTDLQKDKIWETEYKGKIAKARGSIYDVSYVLSFNKEDLNKIIIRVNLTDYHHIELFLKESENDKCMKLNKGDIIQFVGKLDKLGTGMIIPHTMKDVVLLNE